MKDSESTRTPSTSKSTALVLLDIRRHGEEIVFGLLAPEHIVRLDDAGQLGVERIGTALLLEIRQGDELEPLVGVDQLFPAGDLVEPDHRGGHGIESSH